MSSEFIVKQENFEGPLDLLLSLIEKRKISVSDVSLARVTAEYLEKIREAEEKHSTSFLESITAFLEVATTLLLIKSRSLLPTLPLSEDESEAIEELEARLSLYQILRTLMSKLTGSERGGFLLPQERNRKKEIVWPDPTNLSPDSLHTTALSLHKNLPAKEKHAEVRVATRRSLEEVIEDIKERIAKQVAFTFSNGKIASREEKYDHIVTFLALLELVKQNTIELSQSDQYGAIELTDNTISIPRYT